ncbi:hypothetical protein I3843_11G016100 [Carya illinoinensis]|nr:hypothetical protein I3843_11G016100 [Carya illinoinensis]
MFVTCVLVFAGNVLVFARDVWCLCLYARTDKLCKLMVGWCVEVLLIVMLYINEEVDLVTCYVYDMFVCGLSGYLTCQE